MNKTISGKVSGKVRQPASSETEVNITYGSFTKIPYTAEPINIVGNLSAKINGAFMVSGITSGTIAGGPLVLTGYSVNKEEIITIRITGFSFSGTYELGPVGSAYYATYTLNGKTYESSAGTLEILSNDSSHSFIYGTFSFTGISADGDELSVTEGKFAVGY